MRLSHIICLFLHEKETIIIKLHHETETNHYPCSPQCRQRCVGAAESLQAVYGQPAVRHARGESPCLPRQRGHADRLRCAGRRFVTLHRCLCAGHRRSRQEGWGTARGAAGRVVHGPHRPQEQYQPPFGKRCRHPLLKRRQPLFPHRDQLRRTGDAPLPVATLSQRCRQHCHHRPGSHRRQRSRLATAEEAEGHRGTVEGIHVAAWRRLQARRPLAAQRRLPACRHHSQHERSHGHEERGRLELHQALPTSRHGQSRGLQERAA